ncbi:MAG: phosphate acyltransferase PlsX [Clostridiales bacterium]|nr:phosphate acyltransferase PlsX [Clostridiales bacterium]
MKIAIDIMGGDFAPEQIVLGALQAAARWPEHKLVLVGRHEAAPAKLPANCSFHVAESVMGMDENVENLRQKRDSSIWQATQLVKEGKAAALISAGSTAAQMAAAIMLLGRIKGVNRPAIGSVAPGLKEERVLLDIGANAECTPDMLLQFAHMGRVLAEILLKRENPRVALLSNGTEEHKGNELIRAAHILMSQADLNFVGNQEGRDLFSGEFDVLVFDGFSGNVAVKSAEGAFYVIMNLLKQELTASLPRKIAALLIKPGLRKIKNKLDYQELGGAPLLGVNGVSIVCHGSSRARAISNAVGKAIICVEADFIARLAKVMQ